MRFICSDSTLRWPSESGFLGRSGGENLLKGVFFQPVFLNIVSTREREQEKERGGESKLEALMGMWLLKRKKLFQEKQINVYRGSDFFCLLRTGCPLGQLLLPNKASTPPKCSPLRTPNIPNCAPVTRTMSFHVTPKAGSSEEGPHCCETSHPSLESKCLQVKVRSVPLRILKAMLIAWPTVYAPYVRNIWVSGAPGR